ncbi:hypothetical protein DFJ73DRAFT_831505 [Zopfochytrium polystomum]|nr:hypothetical protein DFJ73DRAFT_831505 [Zopfochytrium polystomum]
MGLAYELAYRYGLDDPDSCEPLSAIRAKIGWTHVGCDGCGQRGFSGQRFTCLACAVSFDLCAACYSSSAARASHDATHVFTEMRMKLEFPETAAEVRESAEAAAAFLVEELRDIAGRALLRYKTARWGDEAIAWPTASHGVMVSDTAVPEALRRRIAALAEPLVAASLKAGRWHPGSDGLVLDLIHPSDCPLRFDRTLFSPTRGAILGQAVILSQRPAKPTSQSLWRVTEDPDVSYNYQWLPSEFRVAADGTVTVESYINNLDELAHPEMVQTIAEVFACILPMIECSIGSAQAVPTDNDRRIAASHSERDYTNFDDWHPSKSFLLKYKFLTSRHGDVPPEMVAAHENDPDVQQAAAGDNWISMADRMRYQHLHCAVHVPRLQSHCSRSPISLHAQDLRGRTLQVIVKMAEIRLTPEQPTYGGGKWHLEGMYNEAIAATALVYYDLDNIADSRVTFRHAYREPEFRYDQDVYYGLEKVFGFVSQGGSQRVRVSGDVRALQGRTVVFPNFHQHRLESFELEDKTRAGRRAVLAFFVVNPAVRIASTRDVPRQQRGLVVRELAAALGGRLPEEAVCEVVKAAGATLSEEEARNVARLVMEERSSGKVGGFANAYGISLCEH